MEAAPAAGPEMHEVPTGTSPRDVVWTRNKTTLYRYRPIGPRAHATPVLLVYALINRPYILDLRPGNSFVRHLLERGYDVFLIDWGRPGWEDRGITLDELVGEHLPKAVERMARAGAGGDYTLFGYCMGGTMGVIHAALQPDGAEEPRRAHHPDRLLPGGPALRSGPTRATSTPPRSRSALGNVSGSLIDLGNKLLRPVANFVEVHTSMLERLRAGRDMTAWRAMNQWVNDGVPFPGAAFVQWIEDFYQQNLLARGALTMAGRPVHLSAITAPLLTIAGSKDHIVPPGMARPLNDLVASRDSEYLELPAGHVGLLAGSGARDLLWPKVTDWLDARSD